MESTGGLSNSKTMMGTPWISNFVLSDKTSQSPDVMLVVIAMHVLRLIGSSLQIQAKTESMGGHQLGTPCMFSLYGMSVCFSTYAMQIPCILSEDKFKCDTHPIRKEPAKFSW